MVVFGQKKNVIYIFEDEGTLKNHFLKGVKGTFKIYSNIHEINSNSCSEFATTVTCFCRVSSYSALFLLLLVLHRSLITEASNQKMMKNTTGCTGREQDL